MPVFLSKIIIVALLLAVLWFLFRALRLLLARAPNGDMARQLSWRVGLSMLLLGLLILFWSLGWIGQR